MREADSDDLRRAVIGQHVVVSDLAITEMTSAVHRLGREGVLTHAEVVVVLAAVRRGIEAAETVAINGLTQLLARRLFELDVPLRTLDALHLANAKVAGDDMNGSMTGLCVPAIEGAVALRRR